jgi:hypothetical protein
MIVVTLVDARSMICYRIIKTIVAGAFSLTTDHSAEESI